MTRRLLRALARLAAALALALRVRRGVALANLARAGLGGREARRVLRRATFQLADSLADLLCPPPVAIEGLDRFERARAAGRGVLVLTAHLGPFDAAACAAARAGVPLHVVSRRLSAGWLDRRWWARRERAGVRLHPARGSAAALARALGRGEVVALVLDQHAPAPDGAPVPLFGEPAFTSLSLARLAAATGAPVVPVFAARGRDGSARVRVGDPIPPAVGATRREALIATTARYNAAIEAAVRAHPDQWFWWHRRWKPE